MMRGDKGLTSPVNLSRPVETVLIRDSLRQPLHEIAYFLGWRTAANKIGPLAEPSRMRSV